MTTHVNTSELLQSYIVRTYARDNWPASRTVVEAHDGSEAMAHVTAARGRAAYATANLVQALRFGLVKWGYRSESVRY